MKLLGLLSLPIVTTVLAACWGGEEAADSSIDPAFVSAQELPGRQYDLYWLGTSIEVNGVEYVDPRVPDTGSSVLTDFMTFRYTSTEHEAGDPSITVQLGTQQLWDNSVPETTGGIHEAVTSQSLPAKFILAPSLGDDQPGRMTLAVDFGDTIVGLTVGAAEGTHPLADRDVLLDLASQLRIYPD